MACQRPGRSWQRSKAHEPCGCRPPDLYEPDRPRLNSPLPCDLRLNGSHLAAPLQSGSLPVRTGQSELLPAGVRISENGASSGRGKPFADVQVAGIPVFSEWPLSCMMRLTPSVERARMKTVFHGIVLLTLLLLVAGAAHATPALPDGPAGTTSYGGVTKPYFVWPGLERIAGSPSSDTHGTPDLLGASFAYKGHALRSISIEYKDIQPSYPVGIWNSIAAADWFLDLDPNDDGGFWDIVIHKTGQSQSGGKPVDTWKAYSRHDGWGYGANFTYDYVNGTANAFRVKNGPKVYAASYSSTGAPRTKHPIAAHEDSLRSATALDTAPGHLITSDRWGVRPAKSTDVLTMTWDLSGLLAGGLDLELYSGKTIRYGFALTCANDVLFGQTTVPTPEPGSLLLMGAGALGAAMLRWRRARSL